MAQKLQLVGLEVQHMIKAIPDQEQKDFQLNFLSHFEAITDAAFCLALEYMEEESDGLLLFHGVTKSWMQLSILTWHLQYLPFNSPGHTVEHLCWRRYNWRRWNDPHLLNICVHSTEMIKIVSEVYICILQIINLSKMFLCKS